MTRSPSEEPLLGSQKKGIQELITCSSPNWPVVRCCEIPAVIFMPSTTTFLLKCVAFIKDFPAARFPGPACFVYQELLPFWKQIPARCLRAIPQVNIIITLLQPHLQRVNAGARLVGKSAVPRRNISHSNPSISL